MEKILIVEDDVNLGTTLYSALEMHGYEMKYTACAHETLPLFHSFQPDIVVLDVLLNASVDGFELARNIRSCASTPILFTTSKDGTEDLKEAFNIPTIDYIHKPYKLVEVTLRIDALLNRNKTVPTAQPSVYSMGSIVFKPNDQTLTHKAGVIFLSATESKILLRLCAGGDSYVSRDNLVQSVWKETDYKLKYNTLNNLITQLRKYLSVDAAVRLESRTKLGVRVVVEG